MADSRVVLTASDETGAAFASAKRNFDALDARVEMSAKAQVAAMRGVPAQITDIITSIQGGQKPLTVLLQQGGQLKDMFGGVAPAAKAVGAYIFGLVNPLTLAAGAAALLAVAWHQGAEESRQLNRALVLTGGYAGQSASQVLMMSAAMAQLGGTRGQAVETLTALISTGKVSGSVLQEVAQSVNAMSKAGEPVKELVKQFVSLADEPVKGSVELNRQYHYLTQSVFEQIRALDEQGRKQEAVNLAQSTFAKAAKDSSKQITDNLGFLETAWVGVKNAAAKAWDTMLGIGRDKTGADQLAELQKQMGDRQAWGKAHPDQVDASWETGNKRLQARIDFLQRLNGIQADAAKAKGDNARAQQEAVDATEAVAKLQDQAKGVSAVNRELEKYRANLARIKAVNPNSEMLSPANVAAGEKAIRAQFAGSDVALDAKLRALKGKIEEFDRALKVSLASNKADYEQGLIGTQQYLDREYQLRNDALQNELGIARQQEEIARGKKNIAAAEQYRNDVKRITDEIGANVQQHTDATATYMAKVARAVQQYREVLADAANTRGADLADSLQGADLGPVGKDTQSRLTQLRRDVEKRRNELNLQLAKGEGAGGIGQGQYDAELAELQSYYAKRLGQERDYTDKSAALRADWTVGARNAFNSYIESAQDAASQSAKVFGDFFQGAEDGLVNFVTKGKLDFSSLANSIIADLVRMEARAQLAGLAKMAQSGGGGGVLSALGSALGFGGGSGAVNLGTATGEDLALFYHGGGIAGGKATFTRAVDPRVFAGAPRFHTGGVAGDEVPAILKQGEGVFTREQMKALGGKGSPGLVYSPTVTVQVDSRSDRASVIADVQSVVRRNQEAFVEQLRAQGVLA